MSGRARGYWNGTDRLPLTFGRGDLLLGLEVSTLLVAQRYRLGEPLGCGGMGEVWRATDIALGRQVALKLLRAAVADEITVQRFRLEARAAGRVSNPHIVAIYDFGRHDGGLYLAMELVEGRSVASELTARGVLEPLQATDIVAQAADGAPRTGPVTSRTIARRPLLCHRVGSNDNEGQATGPAQQDGLPGADEASVTAELNAATRSPRSAAGYSVVMWHAWSKSVDTS